MQNLASDQASLYGLVRAGFAKFDPPIEELTARVAALETRSSTVDSDSLDLRFAKVYEKIDATKKDLTMSVAKPSAGSDPFCFLWYSAAEAAARPSASLEGTATLFVASRIEAIWVSGVCDSSVVQSSDVFVLWEAPQSFGFLLETQQPHPLIV